MDEQRKETMRQADMLQKLLKTGAPDSMIRDRIRGLCRLWKITDPVNYEFESLPELNDAEMAEFEELEAELEELEARKAAEYRKQTGRDLEADMELMDLVDSPFNVSNMPSVSSVSNLRNMN